MMIAVRRARRRFLLGIPLVVLAAALLTMIAVGLIGTRLAEEQLGETGAAKAAAVAEAVQYDLERAIALGIPLERIEGISAYLQGIQGRNPDLGFLLITGEDGAWMHGAAPFATGRLGALVESLRGMVVPAMRRAALQPIARDGFLIVRLPLRAAPTAAGQGATTAGHVLVGVQPGQVRSQIAGELVAVALGGVAVLLLLAQVAEALVEASFCAPIAGLSQLMERAIAGDFGTLIGRRPQDQVGRVLHAFNAAVFRVHDRRQRFTAHAEEVRGAVFDPDVAQAVEKTRAETLAALGPGLEQAPRRVVDPRANDGRAYAALAMTATILLVLTGANAGASPGALAAGGWPWLVAVGVGLAVALLGGAVAFCVGAGWRRFAAVVAALGVGLCGGLFVGDWLPGDWLPGDWWSEVWWLADSRSVLIVGALSGGLAVGVALAYARQAAEDGGEARVAWALTSGGVVALLWALALGWNGMALAMSTVLLAVLAAVLGRPFVVLRR
jgi:hypothetical protein